MKGINTSIFDFPTLPYAADPRSVWYVAINYNASARTLDEPLCEPAKETRPPQVFYECEGFRF